MAALVLVAFLANFREYQTIAGAVLALTAAAATILIINRQITQTGRLAEDQRKRRNAAARAVMPLALSSLHTYAERCTIILRGLYPENLEHERDVRAPPGWDPQIPEVAPEVISVLRDCIEFPDEEPGRAISKLIGKLQVQGARLEGTIADLLGRSATSDSAVITTMHVEDYIIDAVDVGARTSLLFRYARQKTNEAPRAPDLMEMTAAANRFGIRDHNYPRIHEKILRRSGGTE